MSKITLEKINAVEELVRLELQLITGDHTVAKIMDIYSEIFRLARIGLEQEIKSTPNSTDYFSQFKSDESEKDDYIFPKSRKDITGKK